jgi:chloride channel protein, CIC family
MKLFVQRLLALLTDLVRPNLAAFTREREPLIWVASLVVGVLAGVASVAFRAGINAAQLPWLGTMSERVASVAGTIPWPIVLLAPAVGGLIVGCLLSFVPGRRGGGPADVIEAEAFDPHRLGLRNGLLGALASAITLGSGGSAGREGPVIHLGGTIAAVLTRRFELPAAGGRMLLGAGVAAAIAASFNAPIAGALFALEVIHRRISVVMLPPIVIASAAGAVIGRIAFGEFPAFMIPEHRIISYWEFPAFALLGVVAAAVAIFFQLAATSADWVLRGLIVPLWLKPALGGLCVGALGVFFPEILGVGYETMEAALTQSLPLGLLVGLVFLKTAATAITLGSRLAGGIFSPTLYLGAMAGAAYGILAARAFPDFASSNAVYAILGMGAVAAAVLGAPISTTVMVFEMTGGYAMSIALLLTVSVASSLTQAFLGRSFFQWQLASRGLFLDQESPPHPEGGLTVGRLMRPPRPGESAAAEVKCVLTTADSLEAALRAFDACGLERLPVVRAQNTDHILGMVDQADVLRILNAAPAKPVGEERRGN